MDPKKKERHQIKCVLAKPSYKNYPFFDNVDPIDGVYNLAICNKDHATFVHSTVYIKDIASHYKNKTRPWLGRRTR